MRLFFILLAATVSQISFAQEIPTVLNPLTRLDGSTAVAPEQLPSQASPSLATPQPSSASGSARAQAHSEFNSASPEYGQIYYTPAYISKMIANDMKIQCYKGLCEMAMVDTKGQGFVVELNVGYGNQNNGSSSGGSSSGGVVVVATGQVNRQPEPYAGVTLRYVTQRCRQSVRVPQALYVSMNTYLYNLINEDGTTKRTFDPAEQTMILFYTTVMKQANGCTTTTR